MWPIKEKEVGIADHIVAISEFPVASCKMRRYGSLININPSAIDLLANANSTF